MRPSLIAVSPVAPWPIRDGYTLRVANMLRELAPLWAITLVAPKIEQGPGIAEYVSVTLGGRSSTYPWRFDPSPLAHALDRTVRRSRPDRAVVWAGAESLWFSRPDLPLAVADVIDCNPLEFWRGFLGYSNLRLRMQNLREIGIASWFARRTVQSFAATTCVGEDDATWMRRIGGRNSVYVVPNGVDFPMIAPEAAAPTLGFIGALDYAPNRDAALYAARSIWPLVLRVEPNARFIIAGRHPPPEIRELCNQRGIEIRPDVPLMAPIIGECWATIAPMRAGVGIKNKVLESWACARPAVMTPIATNGLGKLPPGHAALVGKRSRELANAVIHIFRNVALRRELGSAARRHVAEQFTWRKVALRLDAVLRALPDENTAICRPD